MLVNTVKYTTALIFIILTCLIYECGNYVPIDIMPLYVHAGSFLPPGPKQEYAGEKPADPIEIRLYCGADAALDLYEDEGDNYNFKKGLFSINQFEWNDRNQLLTIGNCQGEFPGILKERRLDIVRVEDNRSAGIDAAAFPDATVLYSDEKMVIKKTIKF